MLLKHSSPMYVNKHTKQISQNDMLNPLKSFQANVSFSSAIFPSTLLAYLSIIVKQFPHINETKQNANPTVIATPSELSSARGGKE